MARARILRKRVSISEIRARRKASLRGSSGRCCLMRTWRTSRRAPSTPRPSRRMPCHSPRGYGPDTGSGGGAMIAGKVLTNREAETEDLKEYFEERAAILEPLGYPVPRPSLRPRTSR